MVASAVPPYGHIDKEAVQCIAQASLRYNVPELLLHAIITKENGRTGQCRRNVNGTYDCGLAQINTSWTQFFVKQGVSPQQLFLTACTNIAASAYILKYNYLRKNSNWQDSIIAYNIGPNNWTPSRYQVGYAYAKDVVKRWWGFHNWVTAQQSSVVLSSTEGTTEPDPRQSTPTD